MNTELVPFQSLSEENKKFIKNVVDYVSILKMNRWNITAEEITEKAIKDWEELNGKKITDYVLVWLMISVAMIFFGKSETASSL